LQRTPGVGVLSNVNGLSRDWDAQEITMRITSLVFPMLLFGIYAAGDTGSVRADAGRDRPTIYAHMSANFIGNPDKSTLQMATRQVLKKYARPQTQRELYELGSLVFTLAHKTGIAEIDILDCMAHGELAGSLGQAAGKCVGHDDYSMTRTL
jgi:hypothetical protein